MSIKLIQEKLKSCQCQSELEERQALREITQEVILAALGRSDFFKWALFQGGTCLRIFYGLNRFSEDLDFILLKSNPEFDLNPYLKKCAVECKAYGYEIDIERSDRNDRAVKKIFLKDDSIGNILNLRYVGKQGRVGKIRIKMEVDTHPPAGSGSDMKYLDFPFVSMVYLQDKPSLFAGKIHALLCRNYIKGRDWYDFIWYTGQGIGINYRFLSAALDQKGPWKGKGIEADFDWCYKELEKKINSLDWRAVAKDVSPFVRTAEQPSLKLWSRDLFLGQLNKIPASP